MIRGFDGKFPKIDKNCFVAETADIIGDVSVAVDSNFWYNTVVRGDDAPIAIGKRTNIQDLVTIHCNHGCPCTIGDDVTIGHRAIVHGCTVGNRVLIGMGAIIMDNAVIEDDVIIGAGALIASGKRIPSKSLVIGMPAKVVRSLTDEEIEGIKASSEDYVALSKKY
ncbi:gamma carbonic anhydrase family protein [Fusibacter paucivorans]|uniref:Gamma carbonic anhydrase family protein n=1 Tax=Fusibacter paucivorans TaxID=76009 RepID=A0ABS5PRE0_9FIRM|nr:gamma carbonic anhydrase family protein [Fusibacter paucivorans]MBS7527730.1 gamma carbonic anhydrase family protein [Fusibacter paucivorans]